MSKGFCNLSLSIKRKAHKLYPLASWLFFLRICKIAALGNNWSPPVLFWRKDLPMFKPVCTFISFLSKMPRTRKQLRQTQILALILYYPYTRSAVHILIFSLFLLTLLLSVEIAVFTSHPFSLAGSIRRQSEPVTASADCYPDCSRELAVSE